MMRLDGKVAVVTGGGSGLGREIALAYAEEGAAVVVASNVAEQSEAVAEACRAFGVPADAATLDVRDEAAVDDVLDRCARKLGEADVLVAAAGLDVRRTPVREDRYVARTTLDDW